MNGFILCGAHLVGGSYQGNVYARSRGNTTDFVAIICKEALRRGGYMAFYCM